LNSILKLHSLCKIIIFTSHGLWYKYFSVLLLFSTVLGHTYLNRHYDRYKWRYYLKRAEHWNFVIVAGEIVESFCFKYILEIIDLLEKKHFLYGFQCLLFVEILLGFRLTYRKKSIIKSKFIRNFYSGRPGR